MCFVQISQHSPLLQSEIYLSNWKTHFSQHCSMLMPGWVYFAWNKINKILFTINISFRYTWSRKNCKCNENLVKLSKRNPSVEGTFPENMSWENRKSGPEVSWLSFSVFPLSHPRSTAVPVSIKKRILEPLHSGGDIQL